MIRLHICAYDDEDFKTMQLPNIFWQVLNFKFWNMVKHYESTQNYDMFD